ncbi:hypothetical protein HanRHA438_Chr12g0560471 [Helianthus annuus]|nr:hypothetical protein HanHA89_Chr12g0475531 [Helianthus annuus]KAJ0867203.1 hypothetical protein HanRHA438_Chr12g0560471 [Helianthus annuus]
MSCFRSHYHHARDKYIDCRRCQSQRLILLTPASKALTISPDTLAIASAAFCFSAPARMIIDKLREDKQRFWRTQSAQLEILIIPFIITEV